MAISSSLYSSISGLSTMGEAMSVLGDNVANVNTVSFKSSRSTFQDVLSQSVSTAAGSAQVGRGVTLSTIDSLFAQGSFESSTSATDMAIGGQGFFMLRNAESAEADMYSRAGEFRFDQEGYLVNPVGYFVQGWGIDLDSGEREGTIGDIMLGKSTPPVETDGIEVIFNLDSEKVKEETETRLFDAWNGTNVYGASPSDPIDVNEYEYTSAIKVYDSKGASHDISIYFDTTTEDNIWEFLVTCDPAEDRRNLTEAQQTVYAPDETYDYEDHKGAGALLYGVIEFSTSGDIDKMYAWDVPPDGEVDPALNTNRQVLQTGESYYQFAVNFTGNISPTDVNLGNQMIDLR
ncbi:MAG: flagellar hook-basal body complex protein, partial [Desulfobulbaceae bacterium]|nr:flagellar hook-basal body complex protein [Desulfobulbaceae bacterium]